MFNDASETINDLYEMLDGETAENCLKVRPTKFGSLSGEMRNVKKVDENEGFKLSQEEQDQKSNRNLREKISYKISIMMLCELLFTGALLVGIFIVPYLNALAPVININLPPLILTLSSFCAVAFVFGLLNKYQSIITTIIKIALIITVFVIVNFCPRISWSITLKPIELSQDIIRLILLITETIFVKTAILAGFIISGLFKGIKK